MVRNDFIQWNMRLKSIFAITAAFTDTTLSIVSSHGSIYRQSSTFVAMYYKNVQPLCTMWPNTCLLRTINNHYPKNPRITQKNFTKKPRKNQSYKQTVQNRIHSKCFGVRRHHQLATPQTWLVKPSSCHLMVASGAEKFWVHSISDGFFIRLIYTEFFRNDFLSFFWISIADSPK